jgi:hypothetical protein
MYRPAGYVGITEIASRINTRFRERHGFLPTEDQTRNLTLSYLLPLLQAGKLKVKVRGQKAIPVTPEDEQRNPSAFKGVQFKYGSDNEIIYDKPEDAAAAIADIRTRWNAIPLPDPTIKREDLSETDRNNLSLLSMFEQFGVLFTLPENDWMM